MFGSSAPDPGKRPLPKLLLGLPGVHWWCESDLPKAELLPPLLSCFEMGEGAELTRWIVRAAFLPEASAGDEPGRPTSETLPIRFITAADPGRNSGESVAAASGDVAAPVGDVASASSTTNESRFPATNSSTLLKPSCNSA